MRVGLLVTGECERSGLATSLNRIFPDADFEVIGLVDSFTSADLSQLPQSPTPTNLQKFAARLVASVDPDAPIAPPDLVVAVDDLELVNFAHPDLVTTRLRDAVCAHLERHRWTSAAAKAKAVQRVRERCSFHLLTPMVEAYFFAEDAALTRAGTSRPSQVDPSAIDLEEFVTADPTYLQYANVPHRDKRKSWANPERARHPKHYLRFLCAPKDPLTKCYVESKGGVAALEALAWSQVFSHPDRMRFARALFEDLALGLGVPHPFPGTGHPAVSDFKNAHVLRNL